MPLKKTSPLKALEKQAIRSNIIISESIDSLAESIDLFFTGRRHSEFKNKTSVTVRYLANKAEGKKFEDRIRVDLALRLPNLEEHWQVFFTSSSEDEFTELDHRNTNNPNRSSQYSVGVGYLKKLGDFDVTLRPGIKIKDPIQTSYVLTLSNHVKFPWFIVRPRFDFFADSERGTGLDNELNFDIELSKLVLFRWSNQFQYLDQNNLFSTNHGPGLIYKKSSHVSYATSINLYSTNDPKFHAERYSYNLARYQMIYKNILSYSFGPQWVFEKTDDFKPKMNFSANLNLIF